jgi:hypothetical protein
MLHQHIGQNFLQLRFVNRLQSNGFPSVNQPRRHLRDREVLDHPELPGKICQDARNMR